MPEVDRYFFVALFFHSILFAFSINLYTEALRTSELSLTVPLICFTPVFFLITSPLIMGEGFSALGLAGMLLIVIGAYSLYVSPDRRGFLRPFRAMLREKGGRYMLLTAFLWSVTGNFERLGILHSSRSFWAVVDLSVVVALLYAMKLRFKPESAIFTKGNIIAGTLNTAAIYFYYFAIVVQKAAYVISVKRSSVLIGVILGYLIFREQDLRKRLAGAVLMVLGVVCISMAR